MAKTNQTSTVDEILDVGQELIQTVGFDGFSYRDIADRVGIKSASVHYHFPAKTDLAHAVAEKYRVDFNASVNELESRGLSPLDQLAGFAGIFQRTLEGLNRVCLCAMLASEAGSVPTTVNEETQKFFNEQQAWISKTISAGIDSGEIAESAQPIAFAKTFLSALEGAMIMARAMERPEHLAEVADQLLSLLGTSTPASTSA